MSRRRPALGPRLVGQCVVCNRNAMVPSDSMPAPARRRASRTRRPRAVIPGGVADAVGLRVMRHFETHALRMRTLSLCAPDGDASLQRTLTHHSSFVPGDASRPSDSVRTRRPRTRHRPPRPTSWTRSEGVKRFARLRSRPWVGARRCPEVPEPELFRDFRNERLLGRATQRRDRLGRAPACDPNERGDRSRRSARPWSSSSLLLVENGRTKSRWDGSCDLVEHYGFT